MKNLVFVFSFLASFLLCPSLFANSFEVPPGASMGMPTFGGSGCPVGTVGMGLSPDARELSILFDEFMIELGGQTGSHRQRARKNCQLSVPFYVPQGFRATIVQVDFRGYNYIPERGRVRFQTDFTISRLEHDAQRRLRKVTENYMGPYDDEYYISARFHDRRWSRCGMDFNLNINMKLGAATNQNGDELLTTIDSGDLSVESVVKYHIVWSRCEARRGGRRGRVVDDSLGRGRRNIGLPSNERSHRARQRDKQRREEERRRPRR